MMTPRDGVRIAKNAAPASTPLHLITFSRGLVPYAPLPVFGFGSTTAAVCFISTYAHAEKAADIGVMQ